MSSICSWCVPEWLVIFPKFVGGISLLCSTYLIRLVFVATTTTATTNNTSSSSSSSQNQTKTPRTTYHRIMINISILDILYSTWTHIIGSWMMPAGTAPFSAGNLATCDTQGFWVQLLATAVPLCNCSLSTYYNLVIRLNWTDQKIQKVEKWLHIVPILLGIICASIPLAAKLYVPGTWACWFSNNQYPLGCDSAETCVRGWNSSYYFWPIYAVIGIAPIYVAASMYVVYKYVRRIERKIARYSLHPGMSQTDRREQERENSAKSRRIMEKSILYSLAYFLTFTFAFISLFLSQFDIATPIWVYTLFGIFNPAQGIFNLAIYRWDRIKKNVQRRKSSLFSSRRNSSGQISSKRPPSSTQHTVEGDVADAANTTNNDSKHFLLNGA